jgi:hypothetical protein
MGARQLFEWADAVPSQSGPEPIGVDDDIVDVVFADAC